MASMKILGVGMVEGASDLHQVVKALAEQAAHGYAASITELTNNSGGTSGELLAPAAFVNVAASGSSLAGKATSESALATVLDAIAEIAEKTNDTAAILGLEELTYNGGGTTPDGTVAAVTVSVTGATTGAQATETNVIRVALNNAFYQLAVKINELCRCVGIAEVDLGYTLDVDPEIDAITTAATGTAADPGVTKVAMDAALAVWRNSAKTLASKLIALNTAGAIKVNVA